MEAVPGLLVGQEGVGHLAPAGSTVAAVCLVTCPVLVAAEGQGSFVLPLKGNGGTIFCCAARQPVAALAEVLSWSDGKDPML